MKTIMMNTWGTCVKIVYNFAVSYRAYLNCNSDTFGAFNQASLRSIRSIFGGTGGGESSVSMGAGMAVYQINLKPKTPTQFQVSNMFQLLGND